MENIEIESNLIFLDRYRKVKEDKENFINFLKDVASKKTVESPNEILSIDYVIDHEVDTDDYWSMFYDD